MELPSGIAFSHRWNFAEKEIANSLKFSSVQRLLIRAFFIFCCVHRRVLAAECAVCSAGHMEPRPRRARFRASPQSTDLCSGWGSALFFAFHDFAAIRRKLILSVLCSMCQLWDYGPTEDVLCCAQTTPVLARLYGVHRTNGLAMTALRVYVLLSRTLGFTNKAMN
jgi:hypothetical protein